MRAPASTVELLDLVRKSGILPGSNLDEKLSDFPSLPVDPSASAALLVKQGMLTKFQAKLLLTGRWRGFKLGAYVVREQLGQGGMGAVYLAEHETLKRPVALKVLPPVKGDQNAKLAVERFLREARAVAALDHPNIVRIHDVGLQGDVHFLVMEYVEGHSLEDLIRKGGPVTPSRAVEYIAQAAAGLQHAHEKGFIHRDIKPANLMLAKDGTIKILDMGLARCSTNASDKLTEVLDQGAIVGTADFISPEQAMNSPGIDIRSDIYSLGATFYALVTGTPPFSGNTTQKLVQHQMKDAPSLTAIDRTFPPELARVVAKMLHKKPDQRYQTPGEVIAAVAEWLPNAGAQRMVVSLSGTDLANSLEMQTTLSELASGGTARIGASKRLGATPSRSKRAWYLGVGATVAAAAILTGWMVFGRPETGEGSPPIATPKPAPPSTTPQPAPPSTTTKPPTASSTPPAATIPAPAGKVVQTFDPGALETFRAVFQAKELRDGRIAKLPAGWNLQVYDAESVGEFRVEAFDGRKVLLIGSVEKKPSSQLVFRADRANLKTFEPGRIYEVRLEGKADADAIGYASVQTVGDWKILITSEIRGAAWKWISHRFTMPDTGDVQLTFGSRTSQADKFVHLRKIEIIAVDAVKPGAVRFALEPSKLLPFVEAGRMEVEEGAPKRWTVLHKAGAGKFPAGWSGSAWREGDAAEFFAESFDGRTVLGSRNTAGKGSAMLISPDITNLNGRCIAELEYRTDPMIAVKSTLRCLPTAPVRDKAFDLAKLEPTHGAWKTVTLELDLHGATAGRFEFHNAESGVGSTLRIARWTVSTVAEPGTPGGAKAPVEGKTVLAADLGGVLPFRCTVAEKMTDFDLRAALPPLVSLSCWNVESVAEFRAAAQEGRTGVGLTNLNDPVSSQLQMHAVNGLTGGRRYRAKIEYLTKNDAHGRLAIRKPRENYALLASTALRGTGGEWRTATVDFRRPEGTVEIDLQIGNASIGEGNALFVHKIEIIELMD